MRKIGAYQKNTEGRFTFWIYHDFWDIFLEKILVAIEITDHHYTPRIRRVIDAADGNQLEEQDSTIPNGLARDCRLNIILTVVSKGMPSMPYLGQRVSFGIR